MTDIDHQAGLVGIESGYWDLAGQWHATPAETKRALIKAMRLDPDDAAGMEAAARDLAWPGLDGRRPPVQCRRISESAGPGGSPARLTACARRAMRGSVTSRTSPCLLSSWRQRVRIFWG